MATTGAKAKRRAEVQLRLAASTDSLAARLGIEVPHAAYPVRDPELAAIIDLERHADMLEAIAGALDGVDFGEAVLTPTEPAMIDRTRKELDAMAAELGIESPEKLQNKQAVVGAIEAAQAAAESDPGEADDPPGGDGEDPEPPQEPDSPDGGEQVDAPKDSE